MKHRTSLVLVSLVACLLALGACGDEDDGGSSPADGAQQGSIRSNPDNARTTIRVGSKNFTEQKVLGEIYAQGLKAAGYEVETELSLGDEKIAQQSLERGTIDGYPEYTGTALLSLCGVPSDEVPKDPDQAFRATRSCFARDGLTAFPPTPFTSSNEVGVRQQTAERESLRRISDLKRVDDRFTLYGSPECRRRTDCLLGLERIYGLRFRKFEAVDIDRRHEVLTGTAGPVASIVFTTDPQNKRENIVLLEDDRGMFPPYNSTFVVRDEIVRKAGRDLPRTIEMLQKGLTDEVMQELNARVDLDDETPAAVAEQYLLDAGLVGGAGS
jgi:osmoprotectant transport system substrate-binding protein